MARGGRRLGAGRPPGTPDRVPRVRRRLALPPSVSAMSVNEQVAFILDPQLPELCREVYEDGTIPNKLELTKLLLPYHWGTPRRTIDLKIDADSPSEILRRLAANRFGAVTTEIVSEAQPQLLAANEPPPEAPEPAPSITW